MIEQASLAATGHTVYASMRGPARRNAAHAREILGIARRDGVDLRVVELDVQSQESAGRAAKTVLHEVSQLDVVVHNARHQVVGYAEAGTSGSSSGSSPRSPAHWRSTD